MRRTDEATVAATLAITFDDRVARRRLALRHPAELERARLALEHLDRRQRRAERERDA
jgi:hypothetical protein